MNLGCWWVFGFLAGTLSCVWGLAEREQPRAPTLIIVGDVVTLRDQLAWFNPQQDA